MDFILSESSLFHSPLTITLDEPEVILSAMHALSSSTKIPKILNQRAYDPPPHSHSWMVIGNLNTVTYASRKRGGRSFHFTSCRTF